MRKLGVVHLGVAALAQVWVVRPELLVALVQEINLERVKFDENCRNLRCYRDAIPQDSGALDRHLC